MCEGNRKFRIHGWCSDGHRVMHVSMCVLSENCCPRLKEGADEDGVIVCSWVGKKELSQPGSNWRPYG